MNTAFSGADILIPKNTDMEKWAVVACDQYTSEPEYWAEVRDIVGDSLSALKLILPEVYLEDENVAERIDDIHNNMEDYLSAGVFEEYKDAMVYVERVQSDGKLRAGIVGAIDLEQYDYYKGSQSAVRATESTVIERIPPRMKIRDGAPIELPHIMILIDDEKRSVIEPMAENKDRLTKLYDFELMKKGGHISGYLLSGDLQLRVLSALNALGDKDNFKKKYGIDAEPLVYAMGDGNHSLATAKECYEQLKRKNPGKDFSSHPARYALVEIVNLHSEALEFEAIHRIVTEVDEEKLMAELTEKLGLSKEPAEQRLVAVRNGEEEELFIHKPSSKLTVGSLQNFLDNYVRDNGAKVDYIHGAEVVRELSKKDGAVGFLLPDMGKNELFPTVIVDGALPRKTFSMGHAWDKRYYLEGRRIK
ncbi:MAG: DUF1015 domain-containing protein [Ruminococcus sp.]|nr:DUF1015 domain-containing protein [Ruminococcus sp.]